MSVPQKPLVVRPPTLEETQYLVNFASNATKLAWKNVGLPYGLPNCKAVNKKFRDIVNSLKVPLQPSSQQERGRTGILSDEELKNEIAASEANTAALKEELEIRKEMSSKGRDLEVEILQVSSQRVHVQTELERLQNQEDALLAREDEIAAQQMDLRKMAVQEIERRKRKRESDGGDLEKDIKVENQKPNDDRLA